MLFKLKFHTGPVRRDAADYLLDKLRQLGRGGSLVGTENAYFQVEADTLSQALEFGQGDLVTLFGAQTGFRVERA